MRILLVEDEEDLGLAMKQVCLIITKISWDSPPTNRLNCLTP